MNNAHCLRISSKWILPDQAKIILILDSFCELCNRFLDMEKFQIEKGYDHVYELAVKVQSS